MITRSLLVFYLTITIASSTFCVNAKEIKEVVILGNSIRLHGPALTIGWSGNWGMAATSRDKDYVHVLYRKICNTLAKRQKKAPELKLPGGVVDEKTFSKWNADAVRNADILIIQLSDNYRGELTDDKFQKNYAAMLKDFKASGVSILICVSNWGGGKMAQLIRQAADSQGAKFVSLEKIAADPSNRAKSEGHFSHGGVNWHPGDRGMQAIADAIWKVFRAGIR